MLRPENHHRYIYCVCTCLRGWSGCGRIDSGRFGRRYNTRSSDGLGVSSGCPFYSSQHISSTTDGGDRRLVRFGSRLGVPSCRPFFFLYSGCVGWMYGARRLCGLRGTPDWPLSYTDVSGTGGSFVLSRKTVGGLSALPLLSIQHGRHGHSINSGSHVWSGVMPVRPILSPFPNIGERSWGLSVTRIIASKENADNRRKSLYGYCRVPLPVGRHIFENRTNAPERSKT